MKKIILSTALALCGQFAWAEDLPGIIQRGYLVVGTYPDTPPFGYVDDKGQFQGFDVEVAREIAQDLFGDRNKIEFVGVNTVDRIPYIKTDKVDFVVAHFANIPWRAKVIDFAEPYMKIETGVLSSKDMQLKSLDNFKGTLVFNKGTFSEAVQKNYPNLKVKSFVQNIEVFADIEKDKNDILVNDTAILYAYAHEHPQFEVSIPKLDDTVFVSPGVKKGNKELLNYLNSEIKEMRRDGRMLAIYNRVLAPLYSKDVKPEKFLVVD